MKRFAKFISSMPFAGKILIRGVFSSLYGATTLQGRLGYYAIAVLSLGIFVFGHSDQARLGFDAARTLDAPVWAQAVFVLYMLVNVSVAIVQAYLIYRATRFCLTTRIPKVKRVLAPFGLGQFFLMVAVTAAGQMIFSVTKGMYQ